MFWKKPKPTSDPVPTLDTRDSRNHREAFRYVFTDQDRIFIWFLGTKVSVVDVSARGMAFVNQGFVKYDADQIHMDLDIPNFRGNTQFSARLRILGITDDQICHCIFEDCTIDQYEMLHKYVLELQKKALRSRSHDPAH